MIDIEIEDIIETPDTAPLLLWWHWALIGLATALLIWLIVQCIKRQSRKTTPVNNLKTALERLSEISKQTQSSNKLATELSILVRQYLRSQLSNQSLFQTHQEFVAEHSDLDHLPGEARQRLESYLESLANHKYQPDRELPSSQEKLIHLTESLLRGLDSTAGGLQI